MITLLLTMMLGADPITYPAELIECKDGDTCVFDVHLGFGQKQTLDVRFCGIDAPEMRGEERVHGLTSRHWMVIKLRAAEKIELMVPQRDPCSTPNRCEKRSFQRVMAWVLADGEDMSEASMDAGMSQEYTKKTCGPGGP